MNWYKKAMSLPKSDKFDKDLFDSEFYDSVTHDTPYGVRDVNEVFEDDEFIDNRIVDYLGSGSYGIAYELDNGHALKVTTDKDEMINAKFLMNNPLKHIVNIYNAKKVKSLESLNANNWRSPNMLFAIEMERVEPLSFNEASFVKRTIRSINDGDSKEEIVNNMMRLDGMDGRSANYYYDDIREMLLELEMYDLEMADYSHRNLGKRDGRTYVLLDIGGFSR